MNAVRKEAEAPVGLSPERQALAEAIKARKSYDAEKAAAEAGLRDLSRQVSDAYATRGRAREALETAQAAGAAHLVAVASGRAAPGSPPVTAKEARDAMTEAEDRLQMLKQAEAAMLARVGEMQKPFSSPEQKVKDAARAVLHSEIDAQAFSTEIEKLQAELVEKRLVMCFLVSESAFPYEGSPNSNSLLPSWNTQLSARLPLPWQNNPAPAWRAAFASLLEDPEVQLPPIDKANL